MPAEAIPRDGLQIGNITSTTNPIYHVRFAEHAPAITRFSKIYDHEPDPRAGLFAS